MPSKRGHTLSRSYFSPTTPTDIPPAPASPRKQHGGPCGQETEPRGLEESRLKRVLDGVPECVPPAPLHRVVSHDLRIIAVG